MWILRILASGLCLVLCATAGAAVTTTVVDLVTPRGVQLRFLYLRPDAPVANVVNLTGGDGVLGLQPDGSGTTLGFRCNPVTRNRQTFADHGFALALLDAASDGPPWNTIDVPEAIRYLQARDSVPIWTIGGSSSKPAVIDVARRLDSPMGAIFFSPD